MISLKSRREIEIMQESAEILKQVFWDIRPMIRSGVTTAEINQRVEKTIQEHGGKPAFKGYRGYPCAACISLNEEVVHGIPGKRRLKEGDLVSIDVGVELKGFFTDAARTWWVGQPVPERNQLRNVAREALKVGIAHCRQGMRIGDISQAIQQFVESQGFQVVRDFVGHGIGRSLHEDPQVPNYGQAGHGPKIETGLTLAIEPMVTQGHYAVETLGDGWTVVTQDRSLASHYEDTIAVTDDGVLNLTETGTDVDN